MVPTRGGWHHHYSELHVGDVGYAHTVYAGDTVIDGSTAQLIHGTAHVYSLQSQSYHSFGFHYMITRETNGLVEVWDGSSFDTLFHFNAVPGDGWHLPGPINPPVAPRMTVLDTGHVELGGEWLRYLVLDMGPFSVLTSTDTLYEKLGPRFGYIHPGLSYIADAGIEELRCYKDDQMEVIVAADGVVCDEILTVAEMGAQAGPHLVPNPGTGAVSIGGDAAVRHLDLFDGAGRVAVSMAVRGGAAIDLGHLAPGAYTYRLWGPDGQAVAQGRWVKH